jgi:hypothetical protein
MQGVNNKQIGNVNIEYRTRNFECRGMDSLRSIFFIIKTIVRPRGSRRAGYLTSIFGNRYSIFDIQIAFRREIQTLNQ